MDDLDDTLAVVGDDRVTKFLSFQSRSRQEAHEMLTGAIERAKSQPRVEYYLAIARLHDDRLVGFTRLGLTGVRAAKLGYAVAASHWRNGYAMDATRTILRFAFENLQLHRITAAIGPDNAASIALIENLGFQYEGRLRDHVFTNHAWRDSLLYSLISPD
ncbi:RimJ/RimL family protein N-acetyltransferase [Pseudonocardia eucalypti]|nr:RimJ/RimL family protein N-acetyltransferase [Pseudonocardia eucalypti]